MSELDLFSKRVKENITNISNDKDFLGLSNIWVRESIRHQYAQNFTWLGRPIIQIPQDIYAIQELIWNIKPDLIIETTENLDLGLIQRKSIFEIAKEVSHQELLREKKLI